MVFRCSVCSMKKWFTVVISKGRGFLGGWTTFTNKLQSLGVTPPSSGSNPCPKGFVGDGTMVAPSNGKSFAEILRKPNIEVSNAVWLELGEEEIGNKIKVMKRCLVGRWG